MTVHDAIKLLGRRILISPLMHAQVVIQHPTLTEARHFSRHVEHSFALIQMSERVMQERRSTASLANSTPQVGSSSTESSIQP